MTVDNASSVAETDVSILEKLITHLRDNTTDMASSELRVPISNFVDPVQLEKEKQLIRRKPIVVAHHSELPEPGSFLTTDFLGDPVLLVRQRDGSVRAHLNVCRHRGGIVEQEKCGKKRSFTCAYHGWTYDRDGSLRHIPYAQQFEPLDRLEHGLVSIKAEERHGLIWITMDPQSPDQMLEDYLGPIVEERFSQFNCDESVQVMDFTFDLPINWKIVMDGAIDSLHPKFLHPYGVGRLVSTNIAVFNEYGRHGELFTPRMRLEKRVAADQDLDAVRQEVGDGSFFRYCGNNLFIFPNSYYIRTPDHIEFWTVMPHVSDPAQSVVRLRFLGDPNRLDDRVRARINQSWEILKEAATQEDWPMEESIQRNALSVRNSSYLYGRNEKSCQHLHRGLASEIVE